MAATYPRLSDLDHLALAIEPLRMEVGQPIRVLYRNWRGETAIRTIKPIAPPHFGATDWHPRAQWLVAAQDCDRDNLPRTFALADMAPAPPTERGMILVLWQTLIAEGAMQTGAMARLDTWLRGRRYGGSNPAALSDAEATDAVAALAAWLRRHRAG